MTWKKAVIGAAFMAMARLVSIAPAAYAVSGIPEGSLIKSGEFAAVYYYAGGKRYVFPDEKTYFTWYADFSGVMTIPSAQLAQIPIGGNVTYRPGKYLVKIQSVPKVYAVERGGVLRWVQTEQIARDLYGPNWAQKVHDVPDAFFVNYTVDAARPLSCTCGFVPAVVMAGTATIAQDKGISGSDDAGW